MGDFLNYLGSKVGLGVVWEVVELAQYLKKLKWTDTFQLITKHRVAG